MKRLREYNTLSGTPFIATLYGYGQGDGYGCPAGLALGGYSPNYLAVYATGANSTRLYWNSLPIAALYKIYRTQVSGNYDFTQLPYATVMPSVVGSDGIFRFDDTGIPATPYGYVVVTQKTDGTYSVSEEDSDTPNGNAIPWNGTNAQIFNAAWQSVQNNPPAPLEDGSTPTFDPSNLMVMAPDGLVYDGSNPTSYPTRHGIYDSGTNSFTFADGTSEVSPVDSLAASPPSQGAGGGDKGSGAIRRVVAKRKDSMSDFYSGVATMVYLPKTNSSNFNFPNSAIGFVSPHVYIGTWDWDNSSAVRGQIHPTIDAGINYEPAGSPDSTYGQRWNAYLRIDDKTNQAYPVEIFQRILEPRLHSKIIDSSIQSANVYMAVTIDRSHSSCDFYIQASNLSGKYYEWVMVAASRDLKPKTVKLTRIPNLYRMKRVVSVDQKPAYKGRAGAFQEFQNGKFPFGNINPKGIPGSFRGVVRDGFYMLDIFTMFTQVRTSNGFWITWDDSITDGTNTGTNLFNYDTRFFIGTPNNPVILNPPSGHANSESIGIDLR